MSVYNKFKLFLKLNTPFLQPETTLIYDIINIVLKLQTSTPRLKYSLPPIAEHKNVYRYRISFITPRLGELKMRYKLVLKCNDVCSFKGENGDGSVQMTLRLSGNWGN